MYSIALERRPDVFPQAEGKLWWETKSLRAAKKLRKPAQAAGGRKGAMEPLHAYVAEHRHELGAEVSRRRAPLKEERPTQIGWATSWLVSKRAWLEWLDDNEEKFN